MTDSTSLLTAETPPPPSRAEARRYNVERSCVRCHQKKIRCDRAKPCSACAKFDLVRSCHYPGPERIKRKSRKSQPTIVEPEINSREHVGSSLRKDKTACRRCNQTLAGSSSYEEPRLGDADPNQSQFNFPGLLIKNGNFARYVNDRVLSHVLEKEEIQPAITSPQDSATTANPGPVLRPLSLLHPLSQVSHTQDTRELSPTPRRAMQLWQIFTLNVDPIVKVLHIPTMQPVVYADINQPYPVAQDLLALLFAIYFAALTSTLRDVVKPLHEDPELELEQFKRGLEQSLSHGHFLDQPTMYSLQAITVFLAAFRGFGSGRSLWTMNGTVIRVAQLMGIHRDGKLFNLSLFDQEMRRRLWWKIITSDSRTLEDQGVWIGGNQGYGDARMPLNIDDRDIDHSTETTPQERIGFTETTPLLSICHIQLVGELVALLSLCDDLESYLQKLPDARNAIARTRAELDEKLFCNYNPYIPIQRLFRDGTKMVLDKIEWRCREGLFRRQQQADTPASQKDGEARIESDILFARACELLESSLQLVSNEIYASFMWHSASYLPYELCTFILWRLCINPTEPSADEPWQIMLKTFCILEQTSLLPDKGPRWTILCRLKERVAILRENNERRTDMRASASVTNPDTEPERNDSCQAGDADVSLFEETGDPESLLFSSDWATFHQNLNLDDIMWP